MVAREEIDMASVGFDVLCFPLGVNPFDTDLIYLWSRQHRCVVSGNLRRQEFTLHVGTHEHETDSVITLSQYVLPQWMDPDTMDQDGLTVDASGNNKDGQDDGMYIAEGEGCITPSLQEASRLSKIRNPTKKSVRLRVTSGRIPNPNGDEKKKIDPRCYIHGDHRETTFEKHGEIQIALQTMEIVDRIALLPQPLRLSSLLDSNVPSEVPYSYQRSYKLNLN
ncbi:hypothetical protein F2Q69_00046629 [Brassica cretica]|uniref:F-box protein At3g26010-like beta-propeller domain-containing protein n=1 Tax=Brassica cretica TaxID=69181 RepID=A0A8S9PPV2_BRACR|nr:hypothetical protein F2Q69_00046629 [Brassica cretica]